MSALASTRHSAEDDPSSSVTVSITGAGGRVAYALAFRVASGEMLGPKTPVRIRLLTTARSRAATEALALELRDCASCVLRAVEVFEDPVKAFDGASIVLMLASVPAAAGSTRDDLIGADAPIVRRHALALNKHAAGDVRVLVVSNPSNTMAWVALDEAVDVPSSRFSALSRLDHDRAVSLVAQHHHCVPGAVLRMTIWGNHSDTQVPDPSELLLDGRRDGLDTDWVASTLPNLVVHRGEAIRSRRGTAVASTANAAVRHVHDWVTGTPAGDWTSAAVVSDGSYGIPEGLVCSFPVVSDGIDWTIVHGLTLAGDRRRQLGASVPSRSRNVNTRRPRSLPGDHGPFPVPLDERSSRVRHRLLCRPRPGSTPVSSSASTAPGHAWSHVAPGLTTPIPPPGTYRRDPPCRSPQQCSRGSSRTSSSRN